MNEPDLMLFDVFGGTLASDLMFPELPGGEGPHDWVLRTVREAPPSHELEHLGQDDVQDGVLVDLYRLGDGRLRMIYTDTGTFDLASNGREIIWYPGVGSSDEAARADVLGRVLAVALHAMGDVCLHASAVAFPGGSLAFIAPKFHGKSTTAMALAASGGRLVTDDTLPVRLGDPPTAVPGVHAVRLWRDSVERVEDADRLNGTEDNKLLISDLPEDRLMTEASPLRAIYLLAPVQAGPGLTAAERDSVTSFDAVLSLLGQTKVGALLGKSEASVVLDRIARLSHAVPVYVLRIVRDFERLDEVVREIKAWHTDLTQPNEGAGA